VERCQVLGVLGQGSISDLVQAFADEGLEASQRLRVGPFVIVGGCGGERKTCGLTQCRSQASDFDAEPATQE
jgi:hypothetical protein